MKYTSHLSFNKRTLIDSLKALIDDGFQSHIIFVADPGGELMPILRCVMLEFEQTIHSVAFPGVISKGINYNKGCVILSFRQQYNSEIVDLNSDYELGDFAERLTEKQKTLLVFYDALNGRKTNLQEQIFLSLGTELQIVGGGAGYRDFRTAPTIVSKDQSYEQSALLIAIDTHTKIDFAVGWDPIYAPMKVTEAKGTELLEIEWRPAYQVYKEKVESHSGQGMLHGNFFELACRYPFGMGRMQNQYVVRDALSADSGLDSIQLVDEVAEGEYVSILNGNKDTLSREIKFLNERAQKNWKSSKSFFTIHCISRSIFLKEEFQQELDNLSKGFDVYGVLSIGELASKGTSLPEILNKSVVAVCLSK